MARDGADDHGCGVSAMKPFTTIAAAIFLLMALVHLYRVAVGFPITVGSVEIG